MRRKTSFLIKLCLLLFWLSATTAVFAQNAYFRETYAILQQGSTTTYYDLKANTSNPNFNNANLGAFCKSSSSLLLKGVEHNVTKCNGCDISGSQMYYRVYLQGNSASSTFTSFSTSWTSEYWGGGCNNQRWQKIDLAVDLLQGLSAGTYVLEIYNQMATSCLGTVYDSNSSANYKATFVVLDSTYYRDLDGDGFGDPATSTVSCTGAPAGFVSNNLDCNDNLVTYADLDGDGFGSTTIVACGVANSTDCDDNNNLINPGMSEILYNGIDDNCDGNLDEGFQKTTNVLDAQCGFTLNHISSPVKVHEIVGATAYRFKVENVATGVIQIVEKSDRSLYFSDLPGGGAYSSTYKVSAELQFNGVWLGYYGAECFVSTPALFAEEQGSLVVCDLQMTTISEIIRTSARAGVRTYRFKVSHYNELGEYEEELMDRPLPWFNFSTLTTAKYGTMYEVQVAVKTETGPFSDFGLACVIISPNSPVLTSCGIQVATASTLIYSETKVLGRGYRFEFTNMNTFETTVVVRPQHWLGFVHVPGYVPGAEYGVRVAVMTNGNWSPYGESCSIFAPMAAARTNSIVKAFDAVAYPSVYAEDFRLGITMTSQEKVEVAIYDMLGRSMDNRVLEAADAEYAVFGKNLPAGIYNVIVTQGAESKVVRVVKQ